jgi:outer membrane protein assembly factor BamB
MRGFVKWVAGLFLGLVPASLAPALFDRPVPLSSVLSGSTFILTAKVEKVDARRPAMVLAVDRHLKGKSGFTKLAVLLEGDKIAARAKDRPALLKRVAPKVPLVLFVSRKGKEYIAFAYTNGTWFRISGIKADGVIGWRFNHCEPYLRGTYKGTTAALVKLVKAVLAGKAKPPAVNEKEKPGLGPELPKKKTSRRGTGRLPALGKLDRQGWLSHEVARGVIAAPPIAALLGLLAMMFPTVFGGWRRWLVLLAVLATNSTLFMLHYWFASALTGSWWGTSSALWAVMTLVVLGGAVWSWQRHLARVQAGEAPTLPGKVELIVLCVISLIGLGTLGYWAWRGESLLTPTWLPMLAFSLGVWSATLYVLGRRLRGPRPVPALATEVVLLGGVLVACTALGATQQPRAAGVGNVEVGSGKGRGDTYTVRAPQHRWTFRVPESGSIASSPLVAGERVYVAVALDDVFRPGGGVYCLRRATGKVVWSFSDDRKMKPVFSSPQLADGKIYIGEGFHRDMVCKVYCLNAATGEKVWDFETGSHTESTPAVAGGKVYCGAGDDGLYCLDAGTGRKVWNFPGFHIDGGPCVVGDRVYVGAGVGDAFKTTALFCLEARSGKRIWQSDTNLAVWGRPVVVGGHVYFSMGNGRLNDSAESSSAGAVRCVRAEDGKTVWTHDLPQSVWGDVLVAGGCVYFGCRDGSFYCLDQKEGNLAWKRSLGSPIVNAARLAHCSCCGARTGLFVAASGGQVVCLGPSSGRLDWALDLAQKSAAPPKVIATPALEVRPHKQGGMVRRLYVGLTLVSTASTAELRCYEDRVEAEGGG